MQTAQIERLKQLINSSPVLTSSEKAEWLDMLVIMNDKQAAELGEILKNHHQDKTPPQPTTVPKLSHISNLPANLPQVPRQANPIPANLPAAKAGPSLSWQKQFNLTMTEKELQPPQPAQAMHAKTFAAPAIKPPKPTTTVAPVKQTKISVLETLTDSGNLSVASLRSMPLPDLLIRLQQLAKHEGYFNLLSYLEDSPLYKSYIATGKKVLSGATVLDGAGSDEQTLTKQEFEAFTDILRKIQIN